MDFFLKRCFEYIKYFSISSIYISISGVNFITEKNHLRFFKRNVIYYKSYHKMWDFIQKMGQIRVWIPHPLIIHTIAHYFNLFSLCLCSANSYFFIFFFGFVQFCARCARNTVFSAHIEFMNASNQHLNFHSEGTLKVFSNYVSEV